MKILTVATILHTCLLVLPILLSLFFCLPLSCFPFPCLKFVIIFPVGMCFINMYSHTHKHKIRDCLHDYVSYSVGQTFHIVFI